MNLSTFVVIRKRGKINHVREDETQNEASTHQLTTLYTQTSPYTSHYNQQNMNLQTPKVKLMFLHVITTTSIGAAAKTLIPNCSSLLFSSKMLLQLVKHHNYVSIHWSGTFRAPYLKRYLWLCLSSGYWNRQTKPNQAAASRHKNM